LRSFPTNRRGDPFPSGEGKLIPVKAVLELGTLLGDVHADRGLDPLNAAGGRM